MPFAELICWALVAPKNVVEDVQYQLLFEFGNSVVFMLGAVTESSMRLRNSPPLGRRQFVELPKVPRLSESQYCSAPDQFAVVAAPLHVAFAVWPMLHFCQRSVFTLSVTVPSPLSVKEEGVTVPVETQRATKVPVVLTEEAVEPLVKLIVQVFAGVPGYADAVQYEGAAQVVLGNGVISAAGLPAPNFARVSNSLFTGNLQPVRPP